MLAYPGIELVDFKGDLQDVDDKQTVNTDHFHPEHDQKQAILSQNSTDTSVGFLDGGAPRYTKDLPSGPLIRCISSRSRREKRLKMFCILAVIIIIVIVVPVGVGLSRKKRWVFALCCKIKCLLQISASRNQPMPHQMVLLRLRHPFLQVC